MAISCGEAWIKFRAPMLERHVGFDVGRHVFTALNAMEAVLCATTMAVLAAFEPTSNEDAWAVPALVSAVVLVQIVFLTPALELRAFHIIVAELEAKGEQQTKREEKIFKELKAITTLKPVPAMVLHHLYIVLEFAKVALLANYAFRMQRSLAL